MKNQRVIGYDLIRIIAAAMVVAIHNNVYYLSFRDGSVRWFVIMEITALCVISVPLFFMVSGAGNLGFDHVISVKELYKKKIPRVFIPFATWSVIYVIARIVMGKIPISADVFISLIWEPAYYQFWFMYSLLGMYIAIPVFQFILQQADKKTIQYILTLWIVGSVALPFTTRYIPGLNISSHFDLVFLEGYWGYFLLGGYFQKYPVKNGKRIGVILFLSGVIITGIAAAVEWLYTDPQKYYGYVYGAYLLPGAVMASVGAFLLLSSIEIHGKLRNVVIHLSGLSMGVYYVHLLIISVLDIFYSSGRNGIVACVVEWILVCFISMAVSEIIKRIKFIKALL